MIGAVAGNAGKIAAAGAIGVAVFGGMKRQAPVAIAGEAVSDAAQGAILVCISGDTGTEVPADALVCISIVGIQRNK